MRIDRVKFITAMARADVNVLQLAERTGLSRGTVTAVRTGKSCSKDTAKKLAAGLGISVAEIIQKEA